VRRVKKKNGAPGPEKSVRRVKKKTVRRDLKKKGAPGAEKSVRRNQKKCGALSPERRGNQSR